MHFSQSRHHLTTFCIPSITTYAIVCLVLDIFAAWLDLFQALPHSNPSIRAEAPEGNHAALVADFRDAGENACGTGADSFGFRKNGLGLCAIWLRV